MTTDMLEREEQNTNVENKTEKQNLPQILKYNYNISHASDEDINSIIDDENSKLFHIQIKPQPDEKWVKPYDYIESIENEYLQKFKNERLKKKIWKKKISEDRRKKFEEERERWWNYFEEHKERREDWETEMMNKYQKLWEQKKEAEIKKMKWVRYYEIEKYKDYPALYNTLLRIRDHSHNIDAIDLVVMENSPEYEKEEKIKSMRAALTEILSDKWTIEEIKQGRNETMKSIKKDVLWVLSQIQKNWNLIIDEIWNNKDNIEVGIQIVEEIMKSIPQNISINVNKRTDRIKFIYRRDWQSWYKYDQVVNLLKSEWKQIIEC